LHDALGPQAAVEVLKALGEYTNKRFNPLGGFSARHSRDQVLTIFPHTTLDEAKELVAGFAQELQQEALASIESIAETTIGAGQSFDIYIRAGITEVSPADEIEQIIERAEQNQEIIATYRCDAGGSV
jgi:phospholipid/cholesterol/gamma-HCH transport system ATP-binding protein